MRKLIFCLLLALGCISAARAQLSVTVSGASNTTPTLAASYSSFASALADLNSVTAMTGPVTLTLGAGSETAPSGSFVLGSASLNAVLSVTNSITINTSGTAILLAPVGTTTPGSATPDGIMRLVGADYVTIDGITFTDGNTTNPATMEYGIGLFKLSTSDGAQNNTIQNCIFNMQRVNNATGSGPMVEGSVSILLINATPTTATTAITPTAASGTNSNNKIYGNTINGGNYGIVLSGFAATTGFPLPPLGDVNNDIGGPGAPAATTGNTILNFGGGGTTSPSAGIRAINQWGLNISNNLVNNNNGSGVNHATTLRGIFGQSGTSANVTISYNTITIRASGTTAAVSAIENAIGSTAASNTVSITNNIVQSCTYTTATTATFNAIVNTATAANLIVNNNTVANNTLGNTGTGSSPIFHGIYSSGAATNFTANGNTIIDNAILNNFGTLYCMRGVTSTIVFDGNTIRRNRIPNHTGASAATIYGVYNGSSPVNETYTNNTIDSLIISGVGTSTSNNVGGIYNLTASGTKIFIGNTISNLIFSTTGTGAAFVSGIRNAYSSTSTIAKNKIFNLSATGATPTVAGLYLGNTTGGIFNVFNNLIGNLSSPTSTGHNLYGVFCGSVGTNYNLSYNTIFLNSTSSAANFASSAVFLSSTTPTVTLLNNNLVNLSVASGTGVSAVIRRSATALTGYGSSSDRNNFFAGTPSATSLLYFDGTNAVQTLPALKTLVAPREANSFAVTANFLSTTGSSPSFLHIDSTIVTPLESAGIPVAGITDDYGGTLRSTTFPDIGADEFSGVTPAPVLSGLSVLPAAPQCTATARTITVVATTAGSPITSVTLNYMNGTASSVPMTLTSGTATNGVWSGTIPAATPADTTVTWSVLATDGVYTALLPGTAYRDAYFSKANTVISGPSLVCAGSNANLSVTTIEGAAGFVNIGTQTTTIGGTNGNPYRSGTTANAQVRTQLLVLASELAAQGLSSGPITSLAFTTTGAAGTVINFSISMKNTTVGSLGTAFDNVGLSTVFTQASFTPALGVNTHNFATPFIWDGVSNVLVDVCQTQSVSGTTTVAAFTPPVPSNVHTAALGTGCSAATGTTAAARPIMRFGGVIGVNFTSQLSYTWNPGSATGAGISVTPSTTTTYTVTGVDTNGCSVISAPFTLNVNPAPTAPAATASAQCGPGIPTASVASLAGAQGSGTFLWYSAPTGGTLLQGAALSTTASNYYSNTFDSATLTNAFISGAASINGGILTLQPAVVSQSGGFTVNPSGVNSTIFQISFDVSLTATGTTIADGFSYSFGDDAVATTTLPTAEKGSGSKLRIGFMTFNAANGSDGKGVYLMYGVTATSGYTATTPGVLAYSSDVSWIPTSATTQTTPISVSINALGQLTLTLGTTVIFNNVQLPAGFLNANKANWRHVFSSRSGGTAGGFAMDNLVIQANTVVPGYTTYQSAVNSTTSFYVSELGVNGCESPRSTVTVNVSTPDTITASTAAALACENASVTLNVVKTGNANIYNYSWTASPAAGSGISGAPLSGSSITVTPALPGTYVYTVAANDSALGCNTSATVSVTVHPQPVNLVATASKSVLCTGDTVNLTASSAGVLTQLLNENFNAPTNNWTTTNLTNLGTSPALTAWTLVSSPSSQWSESLSSPGASPFYVTNSDVGGSGNNTHTILQSPLIDATGTSTLSLNFFYYYKYWDTNDSVKIEASTDGSNWTLLQDLAQTTPAMTSGQTQGTATNFAQATVSLNSFAGSSTLYVRFRYRAIWGYGLAVDSVRVSGMLNDAIAWSSVPAGFTASGATQNGIIPTASTAYIATATNSFGCLDTAQAVVTVGSPVVAATAGVPTACANSPFALSAHLINETFNGATNSWTNINNSTGGTPAVAAWTLRNSPYSYGALNFSSNDASQFYMTNSDAQGSGGTTQTILQSPAINTSSMTSLSLEFFQFFRALSGDSANVEVSLNGTTWTLVQAYTTTQGAAGAFAPATVNLNSYIGNPTLYVRLRYRAVYGWYWAVDNIRLTGNSTNTFAWSSNPAGFNSGVQNPTGVTATDTTTYTVTVTDGNNCSATASVTVNVLPAVAGNTLSAPQTICAGSLPAPIVGATPTGGSGSYSYLWQSSTTGATTGFATASGTSNGKDYNPPILTDTTWYRRIVIAGSCADTSAAVEITVTPGITNNTVSANQSICSGSTPAQLTGSAPAGAGATYAYVWLSSTTGAQSGFAAASGINTNIDYTPVALTTSTWFRRVVQSGTCSDTSAVVAISVAAPITGNTISSAQSICSGSTPAPLTGGLSGLYQDFDGLTSTSAVTTAALPTGWSMVVNQASLLVGANINSFGRPSPNGAFVADNYNVGDPNRAILESRTFGPAGASDTLRFDVAAATYSSFYSDTLRIYANGGSGYVLLQQYTTGTTVDTSAAGITTRAATTTSFTPTAAEWTTKKLALPAGTTQVRFEFASGFGNRLFLDRVQVDSALFIWLSSTTGATTGYTTAAGANTNAGYAPGALTQTTWFRRVAGKGNACPPDTSAAVAITVNPANIISGNPAATFSVCATNAIALSVSAAGATGYQWYKGTTALTNGGNISGANSASLQVANAATTDAGTYNVVVTGAGGCNDTSTNSLVTISALGTVLAANGASNTFVHSDGISNVYTDAACNPILKIVDASGGNSLGSVQATVAVSTTVQAAPNGQKYLQRNYTVTPTSNGAATVTLYALQAEFTAYNNAPGLYPAMPATGSNSDPNISNIRVTKYTGSPFAGGGNAQLITPSSVVWNTTSGWWEISFPVSSFSSFYIHTGNIGPLSIDMERISAINVGNRNRVDWTTAGENNADKYEVERSADGRNFQYLGVVPAKGTSATYSFWDEQPLECVNYYRLRMMDKAGEFAYSETVTAVLRTNGSFVVEAFPNPTTEKLTVRVNGKMGANAYVVVVDMHGKLILQQEVRDRETVLNLTQLALGVYFVKYIDSKQSQTIKFDKK